MAIRPPQGVAAFSQPPPGDLSSTVVYGFPFTAVGPGDPFEMRGPGNVDLWGSFTTTLTTTAGSLAATVAGAGNIAAGAAVAGVNVPPGTTVQSIAGTAIVLAMPPIFQMGRPRTQTVGVAQNQIRQLTSTQGLLGASVTGMGLPPNTVVTAILTPAIPANADGNGAQFGVVSINTVPTAESALKGEIPLRFVPNGNAVLGGVDPIAVFTGAAITFTGSVQLERTFDGGKTWLLANIGGGGTLAQYNAGTPVSLTFGEPELGVMYRLNCTAYTGPIPINYRMSQSNALSALSIGQLF